MNVDQVIKLFELQIKSQREHLNDESLRKLNLFLDALRKHGNSNITTLSQRINQMKVIPNSTASSQSPKQKADLDRLVADLDRLYDQVQHWTTPDFDRARLEANSLCAGLSKVELVPVAKRFAGKGTTRDTVDTLREYIAGKIIRRLQSKFKYDGA